MIKRELYIQKIKPFIDTEVIKVITGIRRCGKSTMLELIKQELITMGVKETSFISYNFESLQNVNFLKMEDLYKDIKSKIANMDSKVYIFLDEIQEVEGWEKCINSIKVEHECDIYITGSNAKLLSGELATYLSGRYVEFTIYPF